MRLARWRRPLAMSTSICVFTEPSNKVCSPSAVTRGHGHVRINNSVTRRGGRKGYYPLRLKVGALLRGWEMKVSPF